MALLLDEYLDKGFAIGGIRRQGRCYWMNTVARALLLDEYLCKGFEEDARARRKTLKSGRIFNTENRT